MSSVTLFALCPYNEHGCFSPHMAELHTLPYPASRTAYVLASDYDRDMQALREDRDSQQRAGIEVMAERDELRVQVEEMRAALADMKDLAEYWINRVDTRGMSESEYSAWLATGHQSNALRNARAALQAKP